MPISRYDIICATHPSDLNAVMADGGYVAIGYIFAQPSYGLQAVGEGAIDPWGSVTDYQLVQAQFYHDLVPLVNAKIAEGYQPIGGLAHWANAFIQAVGKVDGSSSGGGSGGGSAIQIEGEPYQVVGFNADKELQAVRSGMAQWLGEDRQIGGNAFDFVPTAYITGAGQRVSQGTPGLRAISNSPGAGSIAVRDSGGVLSGNAATRDTELPNLKQVRELIGAASVGGGDLPEGSAFDVLSYDAEGNPVAKRISMENWIGSELPASADNLEFVPITMTSTGQAPLQSFRPLEAAAVSSSIMMRDANGGTCVTDAAIDDQAVNLGQVKQMLAAWRKDIEDNIVDVINNAIGGGSK